MDLVRAGPKAPKLERHSFSPLTVLWTHLRPVKEHWGGALNRRFQFTLPKPELGPRNRMESQRDTSIPGGRAGWLAVNRSWALGRKKPAGPNARAQGQKEAGPHERAQEGGAGA